VESRRGVGAGWSLARELESITLLDVNEAVEPGPLFAMHRATPDQCVVDFAIQNIYNRIEKTLQGELARTTPADVLQDILTAPANGDRSRQRHCHFRGGAESLSFFSALAHFV
jgi:DNA-binding IscR family transcriptional regulator